MPKDKEWSQQFAIQIDAELNFLIGIKADPVGVNRQAPAELKRRVAAASLSYFGGMKSIDYTLRHYIKDNVYDDAEPSIGDSTSNFLKNALKNISDYLVQWHTPDDAPLGRFGAEFSLFKVPHVLDMARLLANHGRFLEVLPIVRLCLEMISFAYVAFDIENDSEAFHLKASKCLTRFKSVYETAGQIYNFLSQYSHWQTSIHMNFADISGDRVGAVYASVKYRAQSLTMCVLMLDIFLEAIRSLYGKESDELIKRVQGTVKRHKRKNTHKVIGRIVRFSDWPEITKLQALLC